ncbi:MAG: hypothetical protein ISS88_02680 [Candidatus Portnoybacteria bacterium]|nr:hypothetical protein [Candidatus Portnoybacteria bacterium]
MVILGLISGLSLSIIFIKPKQVKALDAGGSWAQVLKDTVLDAIAWTLTDLVLNRLVTKIENWGLGKESDEGKPFAISDWSDYFLGALNQGTARFVSELGATALCQPFKVSLGELFGLERYYSDTRYKQYGACTIGDVVENAKDFWENPSIGMWGWDTWTALSQPQNNIYGSFLLAAERRAELEDEEKRAAEKRADTSGGYRDETTTAKTDREACLENCNLMGPVMITPEGVEVPNPEYEICIQKCEEMPGLPLKTRVKNWGADIHKAMDDALGKDMARIISADEISELIGVIFSAVLNRAVDGLGRAFSPKTSDDTTQARADYQQKYSYYREFKAEQTGEEIQDTRSRVLTGILKSVQQLSRSIVACDKKEMMKYDDFSKNLANILSANVEALYVGLEGVNLKPDFEILDGQRVPYSVYGYSWGEVPSNKFPSRCKTITDQLELGLDATCRNIISGLEPTYVDARCNRCIYDHDALNCPPSPYPPQTQENAWTANVIKQKQDFYSACKEPYDAALDKCNECIKKVDETCSQIDGEQSEEECILNSCDIFGDTPGVLDGLDFHNKCLIEEKKEACYTCVREYFMPATYCQQVKDYAARSLVKYPAIVHKIRAGIAKDYAIWIGPYDKVFAELRGEDCDRNDESEDIDVSVICRIMPDYEYNNQKICKTKCSVSEEQLRDINDFSPTRKDCGKQKIDVGGKEPWEALNNGILHTRGKCCAAFWEHDKDTYTVCIGSSGI